MAIQAQFIVYGTNIDELKEQAFEQAVRFFRTVDDEITLVDLRARPVVQTQEGEATRWRGHVTMQTRGDTDDD